MTESEYDPNLLRFRAQQLLYATKAELPEKMKEYLHRTAHANLRLAMEIERNIYLANEINSLRNIKS